MNIQPHATPLSFPYPPLILLYIVCLWAGISLVISQVSGWFQLAQLYRTTEPFQGERWRLQSGSLRYLTGYHNILRVGCNSAGLSLSVLLPWRIGHPPLFIPWQDISVRPGKILWVRLYEFDFRQVPSVRLRLREKLGQRLQASAGANWPGDRGATGSSF